MAWLGALVGAGTSVYGNVEQGRAAEKNGNFLAAQLEQNAGQTQASAQRVAEDKRRQARLLSSRVQALAGGGGSDTSVLRTIGDIAGEGEYQALAAMFEADTSAQEMRNRAKARVFEGAQFRKASTIAATGTIFKTGGDLYSKYGGNGSPTDSNIDPSRAGGEVGDYAMES